MALKASFFVPHPPIIIPEIGKGEEKTIQSTIDSYQKIAEKISQIKPKTIIIISPHAESYYDYLRVSNGEKAIGDFANFQASKVKFEVQYDQDFINNILDLTKSLSFPLTDVFKRTDKLDHGTMIPLYFINQKYTDYKIVRFSLSGLSLETHYQFGKLLDVIINETDEDYVVVASGDLSHKLKKDGPYGLSKEGLDFDKRFLEILQENHLEQLKNFDNKFLEKAAECGLRSMIILSGILSNYNYYTNVLSYEAPFGVGYCIAEFLNNERLVSNHVKETDDYYVKLAKKAISEYIKNHRKISIPEDTPLELLNKRAGVFVSIKKYGELRGCIGTIEPTTNSIAEEIIRNAISACSQDPRFNKVSEKELPKLEISVDILNESELINNKNELDIKRFGVIVSKGNRRGLLLPNIEGVNTVKHQLQIALRKAGISEEEDYEIRRFEVVRHQ